MYQRGMVNPLLITSIVLSVLAVGLLAFGVWAFVGYMDNKDNVDSKVAIAVETAKKDQAAEDEAAFIEREKSPVRQAAGPTDLGKVTFDYPKTWSMYVDKDGSAGTYLAYLHPGAVLPVSKSSTANAIVVSVEDKKYEDTLSTFAAAITKGDLKASPITVKDQAGTRLDGNFSKDVKGSAVLFKVRDKTLKIIVESNDYLGDFNNIILTSLQFNP